MTINAYLLLGDPEWLIESVRSYYPYVDRIVASYDVDHLGWNGHPMRTQSCIDRIRALDTDGKVELLVDHFADPDAPKYEAETHQRQVTLDAASDGASWVLQLDADEIVPDWPTFAGWMRRVGEAGHTAMWYPQRVFQTQVSDRLLLERSAHRIRTERGRPGPLALRPGSKLVHIRHDDSPRLLLPAKGLRNHIPKRAWVLHFAWVRSCQAMDRKRLTSAHVDDIDWTSLLTEWKEANRSPASAVLRSLRGTETQRVRPALLRRSYRDPLADFDATEPSEDR